MGRIDCCDFLRIAHSRDNLGEHLLARHETGLGLETGELANRPRERGVVVITVSLGNQFVLEGRGHDRDGQGRSDALCQIGVDAQVLSVKRDLEAERAVVVDHSAAAIL